MADRRHPAQRGVRVRSAGRRGHGVAATRDPRRGEGGRAADRGPRAGGKVEGRSFAAADVPPMPPEMLLSLARRSGGNPLFLQELLSATRAAGTTEGLPDTVEAMVTAQIDQLAASDRRLLRVASVLGLRFRSALAEHLLDESTTGAAAWRRLGDFVTPDGAGFHRFRHALMRDAAYEGLAYRRRRDLHLRAGETIERQRATDDADLDLLALHFFHARADERAWQYSRA